MRRRKRRSEGDIASRGSSKNRDFDSAFLEGTETSIDESEAMASDGFRDAWGANTQTESSASLDSAIDVGQAESSLDALGAGRLTRTLVGLVVVVGICAAGYFLFESLTSAQEPEAARAVADSDTNILSSPIDERSYEPLTGPVAVEVFTPFDEWFVEEGNSLLPVSAAEATSLGGDTTTSARSRILIGSVFWADRFHLAIVSEGVLLPSDQVCAVATLAGEDLRAIDIAGVGSCGDEYSETGDRLACTGERAVLLEVWPFNPDAVSETVDAASIRARLEFDTGSVSRRASLEVEQTSRELVSAASQLTGEPGDEVEIEIDGLVATCELVDRSSVDVRLLPG